MTIIINNNNNNFNDNNNIIISDIEIHSYTQQNLI